MGMPLPVPPAPSADYPYWTRDQVLALPDDGQRYELVYGELLVTPAPRLVHQRILGELHWVIVGYVKRERIGIALCSPADLEPLPGSLVQPDLFVFRAGATRVREWADVKDLLLVVEILSPSTARNDRFPKRRLYQEAGVPLCWIVDVDARQVEIWTPAMAYPTIERNELAWHPEGATEPCRIPLAPLFELADPA